VAPLPLEPLHPSRRVQLVAAASLEEHAGGRRSAPSRCRFAAAGCPQRQLARGLRAFVALPSLEPLVEGPVRRCCAGCRAASSCSLAEGAVRRTLTAGAAVTALLQESAVGSAVVAGVSRRCRTDSSGWLAESAVYRSLIAEACRRRASRGARWRASSSWWVSTRRHPLPLQLERVAPAVGAVQCVAAGRALVAAARFVIAARSTHSPLLVTSSGRRHWPARGLRAFAALPPLEPLADSSRWSSLPPRCLHAGGQHHAGTIDTISRLRLSRRMCHRQPELAAFRCR